MNKLDTGFFKNMGYVPHNKQSEVHESEARFRIIAAGARSGKSMLAGAEIVLTLMRPNTRSWCVASQYELAEKEFDWALTFLSEMKIKHKQRKILDVTHLISPSKGSRIIKMPWGSYCQTKSTEKPQSLLGEELDLIVLGEASQLSREPWQRMLRARLGSRKGKLIAGSTPNSDFGLFMDFFNSGLSKEERWKDWQSWQFSTLANPYFDTEEWEVAKKELDKKIFEEQYEGKFVSRRGNVFEWKNDIIFDAEMTDEQKGWSCLIGLQKGYTNPYVVLWIFIDYAKMIYHVFHELHQFKKLTDDIVPQMKDMSMGYRVIATVTDYSDYIVADELKRLGVGTTRNEEKKYNKSFALIKKIQALQNIIKQDRLKIHSSCEETIKELKNLKWQDSPKEQAERAEQETPLTKYLQSALAIANVISFCENARGQNIYGY